MDHVRPPARPVRSADIFSDIAVPAADDPYGDPIPEGARARLGTNRMRITFGGPTAITPDGKHLVGLSQGGMAYIEPATGKVARTVRVDAQFSTLVGFSADGKRAVNTSYDSTLVWDTASGKVLATAKRFGPGGDGGVSISADGKRLAMGGSRRDKEASATAVVWDVDGNKALATVTPVQNETVYVAISPDGKRLATWGSHFDRAAKERPRPEADPARQVQFWDAESGKETGKVHVPGGYNLTAVVFAPDGALAAASAGEGAVYLFDPATGAAKGVLLGRARQGRKLAFSPDGKTLASIGDDGGIQRWSVADGTRRDTTEPPVPLAYGVRGLVFADNERVIAWTMRGVAALVWEAPSGKLLTPPGGHVGSIQSAAITSDGKEVLTSSTDGAILRWDAAGGKELGAIKLKAPGSTGFGLVAGGHARADRNAGAHRRERRTGGLRSAGRNAGVHHSRRGEPREPRQLQRRWDEGGAGDRELRREEGTGARRGVGHRRGEETRRGRTAGDRLPNRRGDSRRQDAHHRGRATTRGGREPHVHRDGLGACGRKEAGRVHRGERLRPGIHRRDGGQQVGGGRAAQGGRGGHRLHHGEEDARTRSRAAGPAVGAARGEPGRQDGGNPARQRLWANPERHGGAGRSRIGQGDQDTDGDIGQPLGGSLRGRWQDARHGLAGHHGVVWDVGK